MIKTITLDGLTSVKIKQSAFDMERFCWVKNRSDGDIFVSCTDVECTENGDNVMKISAGEYGMIDSESREILYLNGSGKVEIVTSAYAVCPFKAASKGGGSYELPIATTEIIGGVMPDGTTITVDENGVISAVGGSDDWTNVGSVYISTDTVSKEFSIPNLSNYKFMMLSISIGTTGSVGPGTTITNANNYTRIFILDDYKPLSNWVGLTYYIGNDYLTTNSSSTVYPYIGSMNIDKSSNRVRFRAHIGFNANIYMK